MTLRWRWALTSAAVALMAVALVGVAAGALTARGLRAEVDRALTERGETIGRGAAGDFLDRLRELRERAGGMNVLRPLIGGDFEVQVVNQLGTVAFAFDDAHLLPVGDVDRAVAQGTIGSQLRSVDVDGTRYRMITVPMRRGAVQIARDLTPIADLLAQLRRRLVIVGVIAAFAAATLGWWLAGRAVRPIRGLINATETIASTQDLSSPLPVGGSDEVGRLASSFASMISALDESRRQQQRLVSDAGHELRTPLTGLRTNIEVMRRRPDLTPDQRAVLIDAALDEVDELGQLTAELVSLATDAAASEEPRERGPLHDFVTPVVERFRRLTGREIGQTGRGHEVEVRRTQVERAVGNLIDNAHKWSPDGTAIEVTVEGGAVTVRDRGPGIDPADLPRVFDRFYRASGARTMPGSGLGLAIVRQAVEANRGAVFARNHPDGGAEVGFVIPGAT